MCAAVELWHAGCRGGARAKGGVVGDWSAKLQHAVLSGIDESVTCTAFYWSFLRMSDTESSCRACTRCCWCPQLCCFSCSCQQPAATCCSNTLSQLNAAWMFLTAHSAQCAIIRPTFVLVRCLRAGTPLPTSITELVALCASLIAETSSPALAACAANERAPATRRSCLADCRRAMSASLH